jgi:hypothetical protein
MTKKNWGRPGIELGTSRTRSENHTTRPSAHNILKKPSAISNESEIWCGMITNVVVKNGA